ncbi:MAG: hypothetical protein ACRD3W_15060, partial [Terriglobales bacterium]
MLTTEERQKLLPQDERLSAPDLRRAPAVRHRARAAAAALALALFLSANFLLLNFCGAEKHPARGRGVDACAGNMWAGTGSID